jgi:hypothetical protein
MYLQTCESFKSANHKKWDGSASRQSAKCHIWERSTNSRICDLRTTHLWQELNVYTGWRKRGRIQLDDSKKMLGLLFIYSLGFKIKTLCPELKYRASFPSLIFPKCAFAGGGGRECERKIRQNSRKKGSAIPALHTAQTDDTSRLFMIYFLSAAVTWGTSYFVNA